MDVIFMVDNGRISTYIVTLAGVIFAYVIANPQIIEELMGSALYAQYGAALLALLVVIYNFADPREQVQVEE